MTAQGADICGVDLRAATVVWRVQASGTAGEVIVDRSGQRFLVRYANGGTEMFSLDRTLSVATDGSPATGVRVVPNPSVGTVSISLPDGMTSYMIHDVHGRSYGPYAYTDGLADTHDLSSGIYTVHGYGNQGVVTGRFVVVR